MTKIKVGDSLRYLGVVVVLGIVSEVAQSCSSKWSIMFDVMLHMTSAYSCAHNHEGPHAQYRAVRYSHYASADSACITLCHRGNFYHALSLPPT